MIETVGARGVGKSSLARFVVEELKARELASAQIPTIGLLARLHLAITRRSAERRSHRVFSSRGAVSPHELLELRRRFARYWIWMARVARGQGVFLLDEGLFQIIMMLHIFANEGPETDMWVTYRELAELAPLPDVVVFVTASPAEIEKRRLIRANAGDMAKPRLSARGLRGLAQLRAFLVEMASSDTGPSVVFVENSDSLPGTGATHVIVDRIVERLRG